MSAIDCRVVGKHKETLANALAKLVVAATREVGSANATTEEGIASKDCAKSVGI